jgi:predicted DNA-binding protein (MmcQ/YjbR family)
MEELLKFCPRFPEAHEDHPWGETVYKVRKKVFVFLGGPEETLTVTVKLPSSGWSVQQLDFVQPSGYGLGKSGWVTASFPRGSSLPLDTLKAWIIESHRAIAPKKLATMVETDE